MSNERNIGDEAAYPVSVAIASNGDSIDSHYAGDAGLTKREDAAIKFAAAFLSNPTIQGSVDAIIADVPEWSVRVADNLFKELSK